MKIAIVAIFMSLTKQSQNRPSSEADAKDGWLNFIYAFHRFFLFYLSLFFLMPASFFELATPCIKFDAIVNFFRFALSPV